MLPVRRLLCLLLLTVALSGCPSLTERAGLPASVDRAEQLEHAGDLGGAGRVYEDLATHNSGSDRNEFALHAARDYLDAQRAEDGARALALAAEPLSAEQTSERSLLTVQLTLERGHREEAARELAAIPEPHAGA
ncbi:MAG: hypothetical protein WCB10_16080, partial [Steroidobacteraceae bacterium]